MNTIFVLIMVFSTGNGKSISAINQEFLSKDTCNAARLIIQGNMASDEITLSQCFKK